MIRIPIAPAILNSSISPCVPSFPAPAFQNARIQGQYPQPLRQWHRPDQPHRLRRKSQNLRPPLLRLKRRHRLDHIQPRRMSARVHTRPPRGQMWPIRHRSRLRHCRCKRPGIRKILPARLPAAAPCPHRQKRFCTRRQHRAPRPLPAANRNHAFNQHRRPAQGPRPRAGNHLPPQRRNRNRPCPRRPIPFRKPLRHDSLRHSNQRQKFNLRCRPPIAHLPTPHPQHRLIQFLHRRRRIHRQRHLRQCPPRLRLQRPQHIEASPSHPVVNRTARLKISGLLLF